MINLYDSNIIKILPEPLSNNANVESLGYAMKRAVQRLLDYCQNISIYAAIDTVPDQVLNMLALELGTQYYDDTLDISTKRQLVKNTLIWYTRAGTPAAVKELIEIVFGEGEIKEWFEFESPPYTPGTFDIITNAQMTEDMTNYFLSIIEKVKNTRSHIRTFLIRRENNTEVYSGVGFKVTSNITIINSGNVVKKVKEIRNISAEIVALAKQAIIEEDEQYGKL